MPQCAIGSIADNNASHAHELGMEQSRCRTIMHATATVFGHCKDNISDLDGSDTKYLL